MTILEQIFPPGISDTPKRRALTAAVMDPVQWPELLALPSFPGELTLLCEGYPTKEQRDTMPYCFALDPDLDFTRTIAEQAAREGGIILRCLEDIDFMVLSSHLKTLCRARLFDGRQVYFRYYDPVFLSCFLDMANPEQQAFLFGKTIDSFFMFRSRAQTPLTYKRPDGLPNPVAKELVISKEQYEKLYEAQYDKFLEMLTEHFLTEHGRDTTDTALWEKTAANIRNAANLAEKHGFATRNDIYCFVALGVEHGWGIYSRENITAILERPDLDPDEMLELVNKELGNEEDL